MSPAKHVDGGLASYDNFASTDYSEGGAVPECEFRVLRLALYDFVVQTSGTPRAYPFFVLFCLSFFSFAVHPVASSLPFCCL